jgi:hypothetical protein
VNVVPIKSAGWRDVVEIGRDGASDAIAMVCTACHQDIVYVRIFADGRVEFVSKWLGCNCEPERARLSTDEAAAIVAKRFDTEAQIHLELWGEKL